MKSPTKTFTHADVQRIFSVCGEPNRIDASEFLTTFLRTQWESGKRTRDVLRMPEFEAAMQRLLQQVILAAGGAV